MLPAIECKILYSSKKQIIGKKPRLTLPERADSLQRFFKLATDTSTTEKEKYSTLFFVAFPNSFEDLVQLYGYDNEVGSAPLYESAEDHLYLFSNTTVVPHRARLQKQVNIATNGAWEADAVSYFQRELQESVLNDLFSTVQVLQGLSEEQIRQFWYFYSGLTPLQ